jgi:hypothetical protein
MFNADHVVLFCWRLYDLDMKQEAKNIFAYEASLPGNQPPRRPTSQDFHISNMPNSLIFNSEIGGTMNGSDLGVLSNFPVSVGLQGSSIFFCI